MSGGAKAGIIITVLMLVAAAAAGVIYYVKKQKQEQERQKQELERQKKKDEQTLKQELERQKEWRRVFMMKGESVRLITDDAYIKTGDVNVYHRDTLIAKIRRGKITSTVKEEIRERLKLDQPGSLTISNGGHTHAGIYILKIIISTEMITYKTISVSVIDDEVIKKIVMTGDFVCLYSDVTELQKDAEVEWKFKNTVKENTVIVHKKQKDKKISLSQDAFDEGFRENLQVEPQTGSLFITDITPDHSGDYELKITSSRATVHQKFSVSVSDKEGISMMLKEGDSVDLFTDVPELQEDAEVEWEFKDIIKEKTVIAENKQNKTISIRQDAHNGMFKQNLKVDQQTGSLNITNIRTDQSGVYELYIISSRLTVHKKFSVSVSEPSTIGKVNDDLISVEDMYENIKAADGVNESDGLLNEKQDTSPV